MFLIGADVEAAMSAFAGVVKGGVVQVEVVAALGTFGCRRQRNYDAEKDQPDQKHEPCSLV